jgi:hypothetical protein
MHQWLSWVSAVVLSLAWCSLAQAQVNLVVVDLGANTFKAIYTLEPTLAAASFNELTLYFDPRAITSLSLLSAPADWDTLVVQSDTQIPADGFFDAIFSPLDPASSSAATFSLTLHGPVALPSRYELLNSSTMSVVQTGITAVVPEPSAWTLLTAGCLLLALKSAYTRRAWRTEQVEKTLRNNKVRFMHVKALSRTIAAMAALCAGTSHATPSVEGIDLVGSKRLDRTKFEYIYALRIHGDAHHYDAAAFTVSTADTSGSTTISNGIVNIGRIDAEAFMFSPPTLVIRHDRLRPFDLKSLRFAFSGSVVPGTISGVKIGPVAFVENGSNPHGGVRPVQSDCPAMGQRVVAQSTLSGDVASANFGLVSEAGQVLTGAPMLQPSDSWPNYYAIVQVPTQPFRAFVQVTAKDGTSASWTASKLCVPTPYELRMRVSSLDVAPGETIQVMVRIVNAGATGSHIVRLSTPNGFMPSASSWMHTFTSATQDVSFVSTVTLANDLATHTTYTLSASVSPAAAPLGAHSAHVRLFAD